MLVVHAHPDDEAISTGGVLARYAAEGVRTVLVTCTNGEMGDGPGGVKPGEAGHDPAQVVVERRRELEESCRSLGVSRVELLGYRDSGMMGWPQNEDEGAFWRTPVAEGATRLVGLLERYRPQVVVTYDDHGFYGHPDHIQAHRITAAAFEASPIPSKLYCPTIPRSAFEEFRQVLEAAGEEMPEPPQDLGPDGEAARHGIFGTEDEEVAARIDCSSVLEKKRASLEAHRSQSENLFLLRLAPEAFASLMSVEAFVRWQDRTGHPLPEDDLFAGLR